VSWENINKKKEEKREEQKKSKVLLSPLPEYL
jgi:hypothetical protein